jgi:restriction endonuclease Mrr
MNELPKSQHLVDVVVEAIKSNNGEASLAQIESYVITKLSIPETLVQVIHSGSRTELSYRLAWARTKAKSSGLIEKVGSGKWRSAAK